jgi:hypothetical protein
MITSNILRLTPKNVPTDLGDFSEDIAELELDFSNSETDFQRR